MGQEHKLDGGLWKPEKLLIEYQQGKQQEKIIRRYTLELAVIININGGVGL